MKQALITYLPWLLSVITICTMWIAGSKNKNAWPLALANQVLWLIWIVVSQAWGLLPMNLALWFVYVRNLIVWESDDEGESDPDQNKVQ